MYEFGKKVLSHTGVPKHVSEPVTDEPKSHHENMGDFEKRALEGKKHHREESF